MAERASAEVALATDAETEASRLATASAARAEGVGAHLEAGVSRELAGRAFAAAGDAARAIAELERAAAVFEESARSAAGWRRTARGSAGWGAVARAAASPAPGSGRSAHASSRSRSWWWTGGRIRRSRPSSS